MIALFNKLLDWFKQLFWKEEMELTLVGLQYSGKTTFVNVIALSPITQPHPKPCLRPCPVPAEPNPPATSQALPQTLPNPAQSQLSPITQPHPKPCLRPCPVPAEPNHPATSPDPASDPALALAPPEPNHHPPPLLQPIPSLNHYPAPAPSTAPGPAHPQPQPITQPHSLPLPQPQPITRPHPQAHCLMAVIGVVLSCWRSENEKAVGSALALAPNGYISLFPPFLQSGQFSEDMIPTVGFNMRKITKGNVTIKVRASDLMMTVGYWGSASIPEHVGEILPRCQCHCVSTCTHLGWELPGTTQHDIITILRCRYDMYCNSHDSICIAIGYCNSVAIRCSKHIAHHVSLFSLLSLSYMVDAADPEKIEASKNELHNLLDKPQLQGIPVLVLGNKRDVPGALDEKELIERMNLSAIQDREICCYSISCKEKDNIDITLQWLIQHSRTRKTTT
ncbi:unnamed protein product [Coregonus sp. 'balchen']|nr:unnamed protein product [Coregonus sp. 'balchen']